MFDFKAIRITYKLLVNDNSMGSCFTFQLEDVTGNKRVFLITARHVIDQYQQGITQFEIECDNGNQRILEKAVLFCDGDSDTAAIEIDSDLDVAVLGDNDSFNTGSCKIGQDVFFVGYPLAHIVNNNLGDLITRNAPLVKKGTFSGGFIDANGSTIGFYIDGHNNPGFSGGPVVYSDEKEEGKLRILAVVSGYVTQEESLYDREGNERMRIVDNSGIIRAYRVKGILDKIYEYCGTTVI